MRDLGERPNANWLPHINWTGRIENLIKSGPESRPHAHRARITTGVQLTTSQIKSSQSLRGLPDGHNLGMGGWVLATNNLWGGNG
jgi:hypothetical protein